MSFHHRSYEDLLGELSWEYGVLHEYWDINGCRHVTSDETRRKLLHAMGAECSTREQTERSLLALRKARCERALEPVLVVREGAMPAGISLRLPNSDRIKKFLWSLILEDNSRTSGEFDAGVLDCVEQFEVAGEEYVHLRFELPLSPVVGYHRFSISAGEGKASSMSSPRYDDMLLIVAPDTCYLPSELESGDRMWGVSAQLYGLQSNSNWGIGDFSDLKGLIGLADEAGADMVGLNPLHCISPRGDAGISPYSPTSRLVGNPLYLDLDKAISFLQCPEEAKTVASSEYQEKMAEARESELVDYHAVACLKFEVLERLYSFFLDKHLKIASAKSKKFKAFVEKRGATLRDFALYAALQEHFSAKDQSVWGWSLWPEAYHNPQGRAVSEFLEENIERVQFYQFVEWLVDLQLEEVRKCCTEHKLGVGLYLDLALGTSFGGADTWRYQDLYAFGVSMGAPPDELAPQGQDWGLPPLNPHRLKSSGYTLFTEVLRGAMRYGGAVRLDHVMSLMRLFWVPGPGEADNGAYVLYPLDDLMGIIALESQRNSCLVIGEDLGTVPDEVREAMRNSKVLSYKVLYFMKDYSSGEFLRPEEYPPESLVVTSTHDLATLVGFWEGQDIEVRSMLRLHEQSLIEELSVGRVRDRFALLKALSEQNAPSDIQVITAASLAARMPRDLQLKIHTFLAQTPCYLQAVQLEELVEQREQVNLPGTTDEHPNWQRKLGCSLEKLKTHAKAKRMLKLVNQSRKSRPRTS